MAIATDFSTNGEAASTRRYDLDWLRAFAFGLLIFYHIGMFYVTWGWHVKSVYAGPAAEPLMLIVNPWRLALLFLISGVAVRFAADKAPSIWQYAGSRLKRLGLPILAGMAVIVAPQTYFELRQGGVIDAGYFAFWPDYLDLQQKFDVITPTWNHLWYVVYLLVYILLLAPFFRTLTRIANGGGARIFNAITGGPVRLLLLTIIPFVLYEAFLSPRFPTTHALFDDWANHAHRLTIFMIGYFAAKNNRFWQSVDRALPLAAGLAIVICGVRLYLRAFHEVFYAAVFDSPVATVLLTLFAWSAIVALMGIAQRYFNKPSPTLRYLTSAVFCYYILHQTIIVIAGYYLTQLQLGAFAEFSLVTAVTIGGCALIFEIVRRIPVLRLFFGIR